MVLIGLFHFLRLYAGYTVLCPDPPEWNPEVPVIWHFSTFWPLECIRSVVLLDPYSRRSDKRYKVGRTSMSSQLDLDSSRERGFGPEPLFLSFNDHNGRLALSR